MANQNKPWSDITGQKAAEQALKESEEKYRLLVETMSEGVVYVDNDDVIQYINQRCADIYGYKAEDLIGKIGYQFLIHEDDKHIIIEKNKSRLDGIVDSYEVRGKKLSGETIWLKISGTPIRDKDNKVIGSVGLMSDITAQKTLEAQLAASQKMEAISQLAGGIAHDFNNLLTVILGYSEELSSNLEPGSPLHKDAEEIIIAGKKAAELTHQLLTFSRKHVIQPKIMDFNVLVNNLSNMLNRLLGENIEIVTVLATDLAPVNADPTHIEEVIIKLVVNAKDAMPNGGKITIETMNVMSDKESNSVFNNLKPGQYSMIAVSDTGYGMDKELQSKIFDPFFTTKDRSKGLGLGLSTVYGIVKQSEGSIIVESEPGKGTTIKILLPALQENKEDEQKPFLKNDLMGNGERVLIVEDEESLCQLVRKMVEKYGYEVTNTTNSMEALGWIKDGFKPDLIVTDVVMPEMNGKELSDKICSILPEQKVLFMSGFTDNAIERHGVLDPGVPFIQKPFSSVEIAFQIKKLLTSPLEKDNKKVRILMLDDEESIRMLIERISTKRGHCFQSAGNVEDAIKVLSQNPFDVIIIDMKLIGMNGIEAMQFIRNAGYTLPAIAFTGALKQDDIEQLKPLGVVKFIEKSLHNLPLILCIEELFAESRMS